MDEPLIKTFSPSHDPAADKADKFQLAFTPLKAPFGKIAMALSGGGFRASSFSIGAMSYLNRVQYADGRSLLDNVEFISSASGGTFPGILYSAYTKKGLPFETVYKDMLSFMEGETLLEEVLKLLDDDKAWEGEEKNRNLINAFAKTYDKKLFKGETFGVYWEKGGREIEVCFNATEFSRGISFRWQTNGGAFRDKTFDAGKTGNNYIYIDKRTQTHLETLQRVKLGDIMASSSCFPGGFEPVVYPEDFSYAAGRDGKGGQGLSSDKLKQAMIVTDYDLQPKILDASIGLMDGGVDDNQGLYSAILADTRRRKSDADNGFDLIMVADVASYFMDPYLPPKPVTKGTWRKKNVEDVVKGLGRVMTRVNRWTKIIFWLGLIILAGSVALLVQNEAGPWRNIGFFFLSPAIILLLLWVAALVGKRSIPQIGRLTSFLGASDKEILASFKEQLPAAGVLSDTALGSLGKYLKQAPFSVLEHMIKTRLNSGLSMVMDINLKQTRRLIFDIFFGNFYGQDVWVNRRAFNVIYELSVFNKASRERSIRNKFPDDAAVQSLLLDGCLELNAVAEEARTMGTTLWYDHVDATEKRMMKVVACGQFNTCAKLLEYVLDLEQTMKEEASLPEGQRTIQLSAEELAKFELVNGQLLEDWKAFKGNPYFLFEELAK